MEKRAILLILFDFCYLCDRTYQRHNPKAKKKSYPVDLVVFSDFQARQSGQACTRRKKKSYPADIHELFWNALVGCGYFSERCRKEELSD